MSKPQLSSYQDIFQYLSKQKRTKHLLLGNGFSMSYDAKIFSYNALGKFIETINNEVLKELFKIIGTNNFELIMQQLDNFIKIATVFKVDASVINNIEQASDQLKASLIDAIKALHPEHVFKIQEEKSQLCAKFLYDYLDNEGNIFTANYDLLLYWVLLRNGSKNHIDGFGRDAEETDEYVEPSDRQYSELRWGKHKEDQNVHYLHGALPLFDAGIEIVKEEYTGEHFLLENINTRLEAKQYPIFITAGSGKVKLEHIMHNRYLAHCYEALSTINGSLVTFGFNFGEYDDHIIAAINKASKLRDGQKLYSIYIGVYSDADYDHIMSIKNKFRCKVNLFDAKTVNVWS